MWFRSIVLEVVEDVTRGLISNLNAYRSELEKNLEGIEKQSEMQFEVSQSIISEYRKLVEQQRETIALLRGSPIAIEQQEGEEQQLVPRMKTLRQRRKELELESIKRRQELEALNDGSDRRGQEEAR